MQQFHSVVVAKVAAKVGIENVFRVNITVCTVTRHATHGARMANNRSVCRPDMRKSSIRYKAQSQSQSDVFLSAIFPVRRRESSVIAPISTTAS
jgi:hypothetical protein